MTDSRNPRLSVLLVAPKGVLGGAERWFLDLADATDRLSVTALLLEDGPFREELETRGIPVRVHPVGPRGRDLAAASPALLRVLRRTDPDVVLANGVKAQAAIGPVALAAGIPVVWAKHDHSFDARLARPLARIATRVLAPAPQVGAAVARDDLVVVPPPRPVEPLPVPEARAALAALGVRDPGDPAAGPVLAMLTRLIPYKGVDTAVEALTDPRAATWRLVVMGGDDPATPQEGRRLRELAEHLGVASRVTFTGHVPDAARLLPAVDALAVLTRPDGPRTPGREGYGIAAAEAHVAGVPVIALDDGGPVVERVVSGEHPAGIALPDLEAASVAAALERLADPRVRSAQGQAGRLLGAALPDSAECAGILVGALAEAARRPGAGLRPVTPVSVVTTVFNEEEGVGRLLGNLVPTLGPDDEIVVVDGGSTDATVEVVSSWAAGDPRVVLEVVPGAGISAGRNAGVKRARHDLIACTDAGCDPAPGWLEAFRAAAEERDAAELLTGIYRVTSRPGNTFDDAMAVVGYPDPREARRRTPLVRLYGALFGRVYDPSLPTGRSVAFRRAAWAAVGGFPEDLQTAEDVLFGRRIVATGRRAALVTDAEVAWEQRPTVRSTARMYARYGHGGGLAGSRLLVGRDLARAGVYLGAPILVARCSWSRPLVALGAALYLSLPLSRVRRRERPLRVAALVPPVTAMRDVSKAWGCLGGLAERARGPRQR